MKPRIRNIFSITMLSLLAACTSLSDKAGTQASAVDKEELVLAYQDRSMLLYLRPGFESSNVNHLELGRVAVQTSLSLGAEQKIEQEHLGTELESQLNKLLATRNTASRLSMDVRLYDIAPVSPAINVLTTLLFLAPLDTGALTVETLYRDDSGRIQARRLDRLSGSVFNLKAGFSAYGQHRLALNEWALRCSAQAACLKKPAE